MFTIRSLSDRQIADASIQYRIESITGYVDFAILDGELCAHTWQCPKEGRKFLQALENFAEKSGLKLIIPNVLNPALEHILVSSGYALTKAWDNYLKKECKVWAKPVPEHQMRKLRKEVGRESGKDPMNPRWLYDLDKVLVNHKPKTAIPEHLIKEGE